MIAGLVIFQRQPEPRVILGLRSDRAEAGKWCLPTGLGAIRRDITTALAEKAPESLKNPMPVIRSMSKRYQQAFLGPAGFALAEARWYVELPLDIKIEQLMPLKPICQLVNDSFLAKIYFAFEWQADEPPKPAETKWPFVEDRFFSREELKGVTVAFGCDADLEDVFWPYY